MRIILDTEKAESFFRKNFFVQLRKRINPYPMAVPKKRMAEAHAQEQFNKSVQEPMLCSKDWVVK